MLRRLDLSLVCRCWLFPSFFILNSSFLILNCEAQTAGKYEFYRYDQRYAIDATKLETQLGWRAQQTFETGIKKTVRWYIEHSDWWTPLREKYRGERLGL